MLLSQPQTRSGPPTVWQTVPCLLIHPRQVVWADPHSHRHKLMVVAAESDSVEEGPTTSTTSLRPSERGRLDKPPAREKYRRAQGIQYAPEQRQALESSLSVYPGSMCLSNISLTHVLGGWNEYILVHTMSPGLNLMTLPPTLSTLPTNSRPVI